MMGTPVSEKLNNFYFILLSSYLCFHFYSLELSTDMEFTLFFFLFLPELTFSCKLHWVFFSVVFTLPKKKSNFFK